jgi:hypothetical protein
MIRTSLLLITTFAASAAGTLARAADTACRMQGDRSAPQVVELYTSEGCSSCPPADRWLGQLQGRADVLALAFHVDYWNGLGWKDRFARSEFTLRQRQQQAVNGARFSYTPQVVVDGHDRPDWPSMGLAGVRAAAPVAIALARDGERFDASVTALPGAPPRLAAYWAVTEDDHVSAVKAGENAGATLRHAAVVRELQPVAAWPQPVGVATMLRFTPTVPPTAGNPRRVNLVVLDAASGRPVQAVKLGC